MCVCDFPKVYRGVLVEMASRGWWVLVNALCRDIRPSVTVGTVCVYVSVSVSLDDKAALINPDDSTSQLISISVCQHSSNTCVCV